MNPRDPSASYGASHRSLGFRVGPSADTITWTDDAPQSDGGEPLERS